MGSEMCIRDSMKIAPKTITICKSTFLPFGFVGTEGGVYVLCGPGAIGYLLVIFLYYLILEWKLGATLGKLAFGLRVVKINGEPLDLKSSFVRNILRIIDILPFFYLIGVMSMLISRSNQRLGDVLANTIVIEKKKLAEV